jgi:hypothetical protein
MGNVRGDCSIVFAAGNATLACDYENIGFQPKGKTSDIHLIFLFFYQFF